MAKHKNKEPEEILEDLPEVEVVEDVPEEEQSALRFAEALKEKEEQLLRLAAEYDNFRKRSLKEKEAAWSDATSQTVKQFLPSYDNLARALAQGSDDAEFYKGIEMTMKQLLGVFEKLGVTKIDSLGEVFDPERHNAVMHVEDDTVGENTIVEVFEEGFLLGEKVIRFAMVKVAN